MGEDWRDTAHRARVDAGVSAAYAALITSRYSGWMRHFSARTMICLQGAAAIAALAVFALWPPRSGEMLIVPIGTTDSNSVARMALAGGAMLIGRGPFAGSLVVSGERARIERGIGGWTAVVMAAPPAGCGEARGRAA